MKNFNCNRNVLNLDRILTTFDYDYKFVQDLIILMREDLIECSNAMASAHRTKDSAKMQEVSHRIKGQAATMFAPTLYFVSSRMETSARERCYTMTEYFMLVLAVNDYLRCTRVLQSNKVE